MEKDQNLAQGVFAGSLKRNNKQIRDDRALSISEDTQLVYQRAVQDIEMELKRLRRQRDNMLDLSPDNAQSLMLEEEMESYYHLMVESEYTRFSEALKSLDWYGTLQDYTFLENFNTLVFEGSQGIMLDMEHGVFPNVTYSHTTAKNALEICSLLRVRKVDTYYVTRCYQTRHGEGWMSSDEDVVLINNENEHNVHNEWQGNFKVKEIDYELLKYALTVNRAYLSTNPFAQNEHLVVTCRDQRPEMKFDYEKLGKFVTIHESWSPDSKEFKRL